MTKKFSFLIKTCISLILIFNIITLAQAEPENLGVVRNEVKAYHDSGLYFQELKKKIHLARDYIRSQALLNKTSEHPRKLAIILDIDETSLSNYKLMVQRNFVGTKEQIHKEILMANAEAIAPTLALYNEALKNHIKVFFITGRNESERQATILNLKNQGYKHWAGLFLRPTHYSHHSIVPFKSNTRALIEKKGYEIIASIGDQCSDLKGGYAKRVFKLPNPFYYLP